jgi:hypothetical protein
MLRQVFYIYTKYCLLKNYESIWIKKINNSKLYKKNILFSLNINKNNSFKKSTYYVIYKVIINNTI